jgi:hypothetical protein
VDGRDALGVIGYARDAWPGQPLVVGQQVRAAVDAELGILLRYTEYLHDQPLVRIELRGLTLEAPSQQEAFRYDIPPGARVVRTTGSGPLSDVDVPAPVRAAGTGARRLIAGAVTLTEFLARNVGRARPPGAGQ